MTETLTHQPSPDVKPVSPPTHQVSAEHSPKEILPLPSPTAYEDDQLSPGFELQEPSDEDSFPSDSLNRPSAELPFRPRNPFSSSSNGRPHTSGGLSSGPQMQRAYSSPGVDSSGRFITPMQNIPRRPSSPLSAGRRRSPLRANFEESYPNSWSGLNIEPNIPEHAELELSNPMTTEDSTGSLMHMPSYSNTFPRSRRRPTSPLHQSASAPSLYARAASPHLSTGTSPLLSAVRYANEPYPAYPYSTTSSMPSTPTSFRSRSPSISSLETIEDTPDEEEAARLAAEEAKMRVDDTESRRRSSLDSRGSGLRSNKERKRWSVCGAERRADFSLEVIEE